MGFVINEGEEKAGYSLALNAPNTVHRDRQGFIDNSGHDKLHSHTLVVRIIRWGTSFLGIIFVAAASGLLLLSLRLARSSSPSTTNRRV